MDSGFGGALMKQKNLTSLKICGLCGIISTVIFFICIGLAIWLSPWFSWTEHFISDISGSLGDASIWAGRGIASVILNGGLILAGLIGIMFVVMIKKTRTFQSKIGRVGIFMLFVDMSALCGAGIFPVTLGNLHYFCSIVLFCLIPICLFIIAYEIGRLYGKKWWFMVNMISIVSLVPVFIFIFAPHLVGFTKAIGEMVMLFSLYSVIIILGIRLFKTNPVKYSANRNH
jgi:hypothetical membrane protein